MISETNTKTVVITGIGRGIGKALAAKFLAEGYSVLGTTQDGTCTYSHDHLQVFKLDLSVPESIALCVKEIATVGKKINILVNNAGVLFDEDEIVVLSEKLRQTLEVNLVGTVDFTERMILYLSEGAHVVNISSTAGSIGETGHGPSHHPGHYPSYKISKAALNMYTRTLALRLAGTGTTVSAVHPGWVRTDMGGEDAPRSPEEAAEKVYKFALSKPETGAFWFDGKKLPW